MTAFVIQEEGETGLHYDISTTVIDINFSNGENLDLPCKNILPLMIASYHSKNFPPWQKNLLRWKLDCEMSFHAHVTRYALHHCYSMISWDG